MRSEHMTAGNRTSETSPDYAATNVVISIGALTRRGIVRDPA
jgi:hypothetical protein